MSRTPAPAPTATVLWNRAAGALSLHEAATADGRAAARYVADVVRAVLEEGLDPRWHTLSGDYPFDWVGVYIAIGDDGAYARVSTIDMEIRGCAIVLFDSHGVEVGRANFENLPEHLAASVLVAELMSS